MLNDPLTTDEQPRPVRIVLRMAALALAMSSGVAVAAPGDHIGTDSFEVIPSVSLSTLHRTNVFLVEGEGFGGQAATPGTAIWLQPYVTMRSDTPTFLFKLDAGWTGKKYIQEAATNLDRFQDFDVRGNIHLLRDSVVGLIIRDKFDLNGFESEAIKADNPYIQVIRNTAGARLTVRPGASFELDIGGDLRTQSFQTPIPNADVVRSGQNSRLGYGPAAEFKWRFLPKTAVVANWQMEWFQWGDNVVAPSGSVNNASYGAFLGVPDGRLMRIDAGIRGRFTEKLVLGLTAGYGTANYDEQSVLDEGETEGVPDFELDENEGFASDLQGLERLLLNAEVGYAIIESQTIKLNYRKDFQDVFFTNYVTFNSVGVGYEGVFAERYGANVDFSYRFENYNGEVTRDDHRLVGTTQFRYIATKYLDVTAGVGWKRRASASNQPEIEFDDVSFSVGARFTY
ncbi:MAG: hypothetical protein AAFV53_21630 [Myxococcota bacterium]